MDIVLAIVFGAAIGLAVHFAMPGRALRGVALTPVLGAVVGAAVWLVMTWNGVTTASGWIWVLSLVAPAVVTVALAGVLARVRRVRDERERQRLGIVA